MTEENPSTDTLDSSSENKQFRPAVTVIETIIIPLLCLVFFVTGFCEFSLFSAANIITVTLIAGLFVYSQAKSFSYIAAKGTASKLGLAGLLISAASYFSIFMRS